MRAKYCKELRKNVPRFDHFCPWTGNTIGRDNQLCFAGPGQICQLKCYLASNLNRARF